MKFNKNIILFVAVMLFILAGFTMNYYDTIKYHVYNFLVSGEISLANVPDLLSKIDNTSVEQLRYHNAMMDLDSAKQCLMNTKVIPKTSSSVIVRTDCDSLVEPQSESFTDENLEIIADKVANLQEKAQSNGAEFLYVIAPRKTHAMDVPEHVTDYRNENLSAFADKLDARNVNTLNLRDILEEEGRLNEDLFFKTDHHWKTQTGFWAYGEICRNLNERYGFEYDPKYTDISNYETTLYSDIFLGSYGKKLGTYFVPGGKDDFTLIAPKFETNFTVVDPYDNLERSGSFHGTLLDTDDLTASDPYQANIYGVYRVDISRFQTITNHLKPEGKKILIIEDSFGCVVTPFLALNFAETHTIDPRQFLTDEYVNIYDYIEQFKPDYVMLLYGGVEDPPHGYGRYDFDQTPS